MVTNGKRVLFIAPFYEDVAEAVRGLQGSGYEVEVSAAKGIDRRLAHEKFDLVIISGPIPPVGKDADGNYIEMVQFEGTHWQQAGWELLRRLRQGLLDRDYDESGTSPNVPVIFVINSQLPLEVSAASRFYMKSGGAGDLVRIIEKRSLELYLPKAIAEALQ